MDLAGVVRDEEDARRVRLVRNQAAPTMLLPTTWQKQESTTHLVDHEILPEESLHGDAEVRGDPGRVLVVQLAWARPATLRRPAARGLALLLGSRIGVLHDTQVPGAVTTHEILATGHDPTAFVAPFARSSNDRPQPHVMTYDPSGSARKGPPLQRGHRPKRRGGAASPLRIFPTTRSISAVPHKMLAHQGEVSTAAVLRQVMPSARGRSTRCRCGRGCYPTCSMTPAPAWIKDLFDRLNVAHFKGALSTPQLFVWTFMEDRTNGMYSHTPHLTFISLTPEAVEKGEAFVADTLLHEMVHHALATLAKVDHRSHGEAFVKIANPIGAALGLPRVGAHTQQAGFWPQSVRPSGFYCPASAG